jgi:hypothetical protein
MTRIETSRLGNTGDGFGDLADEARPLSESIQTCGEGVLDAASRLDRSVQAVIERAADLRGRQLKDLPALVAGVTSCLAAFAERREQAREALVEQSSRSEALSGALNDLVGSVQFHDITRQQVEHVVEALRQVLPGERGGPVPPEARAVIAMQSSQLAGAAGLFASSVDCTGQDLQNIAQRVGDMAEASRALMGISASEQDGFFLDMEARCTAILDLLATCTTAQEEMERTVAYLDETIDGMLDSVSEIRGIEIRIQRIALNAVIRAVHLGRAGDGLTVIAEIMGRLAMDSNRSTEAAWVAVGAMRDSAQLVHQTSGLAPATAPATKVIDEMRHAILALHSSGESSFSQVIGIADLGKHLVQDIEAVRDGFTAGELFAGVVGRARVELDEIAGQVMPDAGGALERLSGRYTMQMERDVHASVAQGNPVEMAPVAFGAGDLGDNVELF